MNSFIFPILMLALVALNGANGRDLAELEQIMKYREALQDQQIEKLTHGKYPDMRQEVRKQVIDDVIFVYRTLIEVSDDLAKTHPELLANSIQTVIEFIPKIRAKSMGFHPKYEFFKYMMAFFDRLTRLMSDGFTAVLNKARGKPYTAVNEDDFVKFINDVLDKFFITFDNTGQDKNLFHKNLSETIELKLALVNSFDELKPKSFAGQMLLNLVKGISRKSIAFAIYNLDKL